MTRLGSILFVMAISLVLAGSARAQGRDSTTVRIVSFEADSLIVRVVDGQEIREMLRPRLREGSTTVRAERLVDRGGGLLHFFDRVRVIDESDTLTADRVLYDRNTKIGRATGSVRLGDGEVVVTAPEGDYDARAKRADFRAGVTLVDSASVLTSRTGSYWTEEKRAAFAGDVRLTGDSLDVAADSVDYHRENRRSFARGDVVFRRTTTDGLHWILGDRAWDDDEAGTSRVEGDVLLATIRVDSTSADTLFLAAGRLHSARADSVERYAAADSVRLWRTEFAAVADSVAFERFAGPDSTGGPATSRLLGRPVAWFRSTQVHGDTLVVVGRGESMDTLRVWPNAFVARMDSTTGRLQQLRGDRLTGLFRDDSLRSVHVSGRSEAVYWLEADEEREGGAMRVSADSIRFRLDGDRLSDLGVYDGVEGTWYPAHLVTAEVDLEGLAWEPGRRPDAAPFRLRLASRICRFGGPACAEPPCEPGDDACGGKKPDLPPDPRPDRP